MESYKKLLSENKAWAQSKLDNDADFFSRMSKEQKPDFLWIGCSDSRVPANEITNTDPGVMFVHRNIANMVIHSDLNLLSVLQYAVEVLEVKHVIVCGHYGCGGVKAALSNQSLGIINNWLRHIKDVYRMHRDEINAIPDMDEKVDRLVEFNIYEQVQNLARTSIVQGAWHKRKGPTLHGWVYRMNNGVLKEIFTMDYTTPPDPIYRYDFGSSL